MKNKNLERIAAIAEIQTLMTKNEILFAFRLIKGRKIQRKHQVTDERLVAIITTMAWFGYGQWMQLKEFFRLVALFKEYPEVNGNSRFYFENGDFSSLAAIPPVDLHKKFGNELHPLITILSDNWYKILKLESNFAPSELKGLNTDILLFDEITNLGVPVIEVKITQSDFDNIPQIKDEQDRKLLEQHLNLGDYKLSSNLQKGAEAGEALRGQFREYTNPKAEQYIDAHMKEFLQNYSEDYETAKQMLISSEITSALMVEQMFEPLKNLWLMFSIEKQLSVHLKVISDLSYRGLHHAFDHPYAQKYFEELFKKY